MATKVKLPLIEAFKKKVKLPKNVSYSMPQINKPEIWSEILKHSDLQYYKGSENLQIFNMYPGIGALPIAFQDLLHPKLQVMIDVSKKMHKLHDKLVVPVLKDANVADRFRYVDLNPYVWESFSELIKCKYMEEPEVFKPKDSSLAHPNFIISGNYISAYGEGLCFQHINCFANKNWAYKYGSAKTFLILSANTASKIFGERLGKKKISRISCMFDAYTDHRLLAINESNTEGYFSEGVIDSSDPYIIPDNVIDCSAGKRAAGFAVIEATPRTIAADVNLDYFDYITKQLFIMPKTELKECINLLGFGAYEFFSGYDSFKKIEHLPPSELSYLDFFELSKIFYEWPFKPDVLLSFEEDELQFKRKIV